MRHSIPLGTSVSFQGNSTIYKACDYLEVHACRVGCTFDHDHYEEPYIAVKEEIRHCFPLSQLNHVFDAHGIGRDATAFERTPRP